MNPLKPFMELFFPREKRVVDIYYDKREEVLRFEVSWYDGFRHRLETFEFRPGHLDEDIEKARQGGVFNEVYRWVDLKLALQDYSGYSPRAFLEELLEKGESPSLYPIWYKRPA